MKEITGVLKTLGSGSTRHGSVGSSSVKYNTIEIGDTLLQKVVSSQSLNDFVERGLGKEVTLFLNKKYAYRSETTRRKNLLLEKKLLAIFI